jgi:hypothetical protein
MVTLKLRRGDKFLSTDPGKGETCRNYLRTYKFADILVRGISLREGFGELEIRKLCLVAKEVAE